MLALFRGQAGTRWTHIVSFFLPSPALSVPLSYTSSGGHAYHTKRHVPAEKRPRTYRNHRQTFRYDGRDDSGGDFGCYLYRFEGKFGDSMCMDGEGAEGGGRPGQRGRSGPGLGRGCAGGQVGADAEDGGICGGQKKTERTRRTRVDGDYDSGRRGQRRGARERKALGGGGTGEQVVGGRPSPSPRARAVRGRGSGSRRGAPLRPPPAPSPLSFLPFNLPLFSPFITRTPFSLQYGLRVDF
ncbi:hypothetical protein SETIT_9G250900v2 [Setaria italica]|uniref:Uncharacterized protein n=1 Tax=Setaria italica TaxID=4555 RepID=A0A368SKD1_SETIT|nr:hypothetical protein SETIT_9G250900v2 [Setaria italica]